MYNKYFVLKRKGHTPKKAGFNILHPLLHPFRPLWRSGGLMVSVVNLQLSSTGSSPGQAIGLCSWARLCTLTVTLFTQAYEWVPLNLMLEITL